MKVKNFVVGPFLNCWYPKQWDRKTAQGIYHNCMFVRGWLRAIASHPARKDKLGSEEEISFILSHILTIGAYGKDAEATPTFGH